MITLIYILNEIIENIFMNLPQYIQAMKKASTKKPLKALPRPTWKPQVIAFNIISNKKFDMLIMAFIGLNMVR